MNQSVGYSSPYGHIDAINGRVNLKSPHNRWSMPKRLIVECLVATQSNHVLKNKRTTISKMGTNDGFQVRIVPGLCFVFGPGTTASASSPPLNNCPTIEALFFRKWFNIVNKFTFVTVSHETTTRSQMILMEFKKTEIKF